MRTARYEQEHNVYVPDEFEDQELRGGSQLVVTRGSGWRWPLMYVSVPLRSDVVPNSRLWRVGRAGVKWRRAAA